jgi:hypothetical protein
MVAMSAVHARVVAPPVTPHPFGLFSVAPPTTPAGTDWMAGVQWRSVACAPIAVTYDPCVTGQAVTPKVAQVCSDIENWISLKPFTVLGFFKWSGESSDVARAEAADVLTGGEEFAAEKALWVAMEQVPPTGTATDPILALAAVEQDLGENYHGTGVIHLSRFLGIVLADQLERQGGRLQTRIGTPVVVGGGYDTDTDDAGPFTIYGTGTLLVNRGPVDYIETANTSVNDLYVLGERTYVIGWDCHIVGRQALVTGGP